MIDHVIIRVGDYKKSRQFYEKALGALGYGVVMDFGGENGVGLGIGGKPEFFIVPGPTNGNTHIAIGADNRAAVDAFYRAAIDAGATDNGAPGPRTQYHANYYGAFVKDPDGNNIEAVNHTGA
jgi:catechol 2,3-dioxygenase-like lactoylglutathione lyase family enzyme